MRKQISKAEFIRRVTANRTIFIGISPSGKEIEAVKERLKNHSLVPRYCIAKANQHLVFGVQPPTEPFINDSHLYLADVKPHTFYTCYEEDDILIVEQKWLDIDWSGKVQDTVYKYLYYKEVN